MDERNSSRAQSSCVDERSPDPLLARVMGLPWERPATPRRVEGRFKMEPPKLAITIHEPSRNAEQRKQALAPLAQMISEPTIAELERREPEIHAWLAQGADRAARFLLDPLGCLEKAKITLSASALSELGRVRHAQLQAIDPAVLTTIRSLTVKLG
jgi:hypothetical protein